MVLNWQAIWAFSKIGLYLIVIAVAVCSQHHYRTFNVLISHDCITIRCHIWMDQASCAVYFLWIVAEVRCTFFRRTSLRLVLLCFDPWLADAPTCIGSRFWTICFMRFHRRCNLKTVPNIVELSLVSGIGPLIKWNVPVLPMDRRLRAPQTSGPYALGHTFPPTSDAPDYPLVLVGLGLGVGEGLGLRVELGLGNHITISTRGVIICQGVENGHNTGTNRDGCVRLEIKVL